MMLIVKKKYFDMSICLAAGLFRVTLKSREPYRTFRDVTPEPLTLRNHMCGSAVCGGVGKQQKLSVVTHVIIVSW
jgi:hypothetical protein